MRTPRFLRKACLVNEQTHLRVVNRHAEARIQYRSPDRRCLGPPATSWTMHHAIDPRASSLLPIWVGCCWHSHLLLLLLNFNCVTVWIANHECFLESELNIRIRYYDQRYKRHMRGLRFAR